MMLNRPNRVGEYDPGLPKRRNLTKSEIDELKKKNSVLLEKTLLLVKELNKTI